MVWGKDLGSSGQCPPNVSQKVSRLVVSHAMPWVVETRPMPRLCVSGLLLTVSTRAAFVHLHCIAFPWVHVDLRTTGSLLRSRLRYLALAPTCSLLRAAGCGLFHSMCHIMVTTTSCKLHDSFLCFHNIS